MPLRPAAAVLLRLANFALVKIGALRQTQLPVSSAGRGRCVCLLRLANFPGGRRCALVKIGALRQLRLAASAAGSARLSCPHTGALCRGLLLLGLRCGVTSTEALPIEGKGLYTADLPLRICAVQVLQLRQRQKKKEQFSARPPEGDAAQRQGDTSKRVEGGFRS